MNTTNVNNSTSDPQKAEEPVTRRGRPLPTVTPQGFLGPIAAPLVYDVDVKSMATVLSDVLLRKALFR